MCRKRNNNKWERKNGTRTDVAGERGQRITKPFDRNLLEERERERDIGTCKRAKERDREIVTCKRARERERSLNERWIDTEQNCWSRITPLIRTDQQ